MPPLSILVVEDDPLARELIAPHLNDHTVEFAGDEKEARKKLESRRPDICFIDLQLGAKDDCSGLKLIPLAAAKGSYSVVMSGHDAEPNVDKAYALGCDHFFAKGNIRANVAAVLSRYEQKKKETEEENRVFADRYVTTDPATRSAITEALKYASSELPMLILGPSGTGKTTLAQIIHERSGRHGEFVAINCSSYTEDLLEAELFGYRKGAFTDAKDNRKGKLLLADQGTLFLDEIGSMSLKMQTKLLKAIEEKRFYPLGSEKEETSRFRIISATLEDLPELIKGGKLRLDFFQRIHGLTVKLPPLSERPCDIFPLIARFSRDGRKVSFSAEAKDRLARHSWPGNVRELKKLLDLLMAGDEGRITEERVAHLLSSLSIEEGGEAITSEQYRFALEHGLPALVERVVEAAIKKNLAENGGRKRKALLDLRTDTRTLYNALRRNRSRIAVNADDTKR